MIFIFSVNKDGEKHWNISFSQYPYGILTKMNFDMVLLHEFFLPLLGFNVILRIEKLCSRKEDGSAMDLLF